MGYKYSCLLYTSNCSSRNCSLYNNIWDTNTLVTPENTRIGNVGKSKGHLPKKSAWSVEVYPFPTSLSAGERAILIEDIRLRQCLPSTDAYQELLRERTEKRHQVGEEFYGTGAMIDRNWSLPNQPLRHVVTRLAVHGYHHKVCETTSYHKVNDKCVCKQCKKFYGQYHITKSAEITKSITEYALEDRS
ncbi:hypothetical protein C0J52_24471 [Blattella germanica]|nr:hypothetical protein C0J52_24471 [Blattella germanica]